MHVNICECSVVIIFGSKLQILNQLEISIALTLARISSWSVLTPNLGMLEFVKLELCINFFTPLIWDIGRFFFSFSFCVGDGISISCCLSFKEEKKIYILFANYSYLVRNNIRSSIAFHKNVLQNHFEIRRCKSPSNLLTCSFSSFALAMKNS